MAQSSDPHPDAPAGASDPPGELLDDRRRQQRQEVSEIAYIAGDGSSVQCRVVNISQYGAAVEIPHTLHIRPRFKLMLESDRIIRTCRLIWSTGNRIGVEFVD